MHYSDRFSREGIANIFQLFDEEKLGYMTRETMR